MSLRVDSQAARPKPEPNEVTLSLVNSVSSRRAQKSGQDAPNGFRGARLPDFWKGHWRHMWVSFFVDDDQRNRNAVAWRYARL